VKAKSASFLDTVCAQSCQCQKSSSTGCHKKKPARFANGAKHVGLGAQSNALGGTPHGQSHLASLKVLRGLQSSPGRSKQKRAADFSVTLCKTIDLSFL